jgi:outer membrane protein assembly factor BamB
MNTQWKHGGALLLFLLGCLLGSCGGTPSGVSTNATPSPLLSQTVYVVSTAGLSAYQASDGKRRWSFQPSSPPLFSAQEPLALGNDVVYWVADQLYALDASDGKPQWRAPVGESPGAIAVSGNLVYVLSADVLYAFERVNRTLRWRQQLAYSLDTSVSLLLEQGTLYAINGAHLTALHADSGAILWQFNLDPGLGESITNIFLTNNALLVWSPTTLDGLDANTGRALWHKETQAKDVRVVGETIYAIFIDVPSGGLGNSVTGLRALRLRDGAELWQVNAPVQDGQPSFISDTTFFRAVGPTGGDVEARSTRDGHLLWQRPSGNTFVHLLADSGMLYLETQQGEIDSLRAADGNPLWTYPGASGDLSLSLTNHVLYLVGKDAGQVVALDAITGKPLWGLRWATASALSSFLERAGASLLP